MGSFLLQWTVGRIATPFTILPYRSTSMIDLPSITFRIAVCVSTILLAPVAGWGAFEDIETFDALAVGEVDNQNGWSATTGLATVANDPGDPTNQLLELAPFPGTLARAARVPQGTARMLFLRFRFEDQQNLSFGMSHLNAPKEFSDFTSELRKSDSANSLKIHDGARYELLTVLQPDEWYNLWAYIDNDSDESSVWLHHRDGEDALLSDQLESGGQTIFDFRTSTSSNLVNFYIKSSSGGGKAGFLWMDDIYLEDTNRLNLANPTVPFPLGDFNHDRLVDGMDIDLLSTAIAQNLMNDFYDLDQSGAVDQGDLKMMIHDLLETSYGDANLDRVFNSTDFVEVFQAGKYEQDLQAGWVDGDWNADLRFESADIVIAMQEGTYEREPFGAMPAVPEPSGILLFIVACLAMAFQRPTAR